jgi:hypothetical protein
MIDQEEVTRLGLSSTLVGADDLAIAREQHKNEQAATAAAAADAALFEEGPQPAQDGQGQAPDAAEVAEEPEAAAEAKAGRRGR